MVLRSHLSRASLPAAFAIACIAGNACSHGTQLDEIAGRLAADASTSVGIDGGADAGVMSGIDGGFGACAIELPGSRAELEGVHLFAADASGSEQQVRVGPLQTSVREGGEVQLRLDGEVVLRQGIDSSASITSDGSLQLTLQLPDDGSAHHLEARCLDATDVVLGQRSVALQVDMAPCRVEILSPEDGAELTHEHAAVRENESGLRLYVNVSVEGFVNDDAAGDCIELELQWGTMASSHPLQREQDQQVEGLLMLSEVGPLELCASVSDLAGNENTTCIDLVQAACPSGSLLCGDACRDDTDDNPDACGPTCEVCPEAPEDAQRVCTAGSCDFVCNADFYREGETCRFRPGCDQLASACNEGDCCAIDAIAPAASQSLTVQRGYDASNDGTDVQGWQSHDTSAIVQLTPFELDRHEVVVGRFRAFVQAYDDWAGQGGLNPRPDQGRNPNVPNSGWRSEWTTATVYDTVIGETLPLVPDDAADLRVRLTACSPATWTDAPGDNEGKPVSCVSFYEAFLFCIWDGARLPTEAEWNLAAAGAGQQRAYPWSSPPESLSIETSRAAYGRQEGQGPLVAGSRPAGAGRWGSQDLAGNVWEWVRDTATPAGLNSYVAGARDPLDLTDDSDPNTRHLLRGGSYKIGASNLAWLRTAHRQLRDGSLRINDVGFRCARPAGGS